MAATTTAQKTTTTHRRPPQNKNLTELGKLLSDADKSAEKPTTAVVGGGGRSATGDNGVRPTSAAECMAKAAERAAAARGQKSPSATSGARPAASSASSASSTASQPAKPKGTVDLGAYSLIYHRPSVTGPDGVEHKCRHTTWGHEAEKAAMACARKLASEAGLQI